MTFIVIIISLTIFKIILCHYFSLHYISFNSVIYHYKFFIIFICLL